MSAYSLADFRVLAIIAVPFYLAGGFAWPFLYAGLLAQAVYLFSRAYDLGRLPLVGVNDTLTFLAASIILFSIPFHRTLKVKKFRWMVALGAAVFSAAAFAQGPYNMPLPPVLKTYWFELHVSLSFFSYALFAIGAALGITYLGNPLDAGLEKKEYKAILFGYLLFSLSMIFGGVWAYLAWGTYWLWTPKELWTSILWLYYTGYLHARFQRQWYGKKAAIIGAAGFAVVLFTYLGVSLLMKSSHSF